MTLPPAASGRSVIILQRLCTCLLRELLRVMLIVPDEGVVVGAQAAFGQLLEDIVQVGRVLRVDVLDAAQALQIFF